MVHEHHRVDRHQLRRFVVLGGAVVRALALQLEGREFKSPRSRWQEISSIRADDCVNLRITPFGKALTHIVPSPLERSIIYSVGSYTCECSYCAHWIIEESIQRAVCRLLLYRFSVHCNLYSALKEFLGISCSALKMSNIKCLILIFLHSLSVLHLILALSHSPCIYLCRRSNKTNKQITCKQKELAARGRNSRDTFFHVYPGYMTKQNCTWRKAAFPEHIQMPCFTGVCNRIKHPYWNIDWSFE